MLLPNVDWKIFTQLRARYARHAGDARRTRERDDGQRREHVFQGAVRKSREVVHEENDETIRGTTGWRTVLWRVVKCFCLKGIMVPIPSRPKFQALSYHVTGSSCGRIESAKSSRFPQEPIFSNIYTRFPCGIESIELWKRFSRLWKSIEFV